MPTPSTPSAASAGNAVWPARPGISVKLTALHPRFEAVSRERVLAELPPRVLELARMAKARELVFTIDAEEADRLELSLDVIGAVLGDPSLRGFDGFGLAVQAYQKRALAVIDWVEAAATAFGSRLTVRLVKGAYWDTEIKRAQERGLADYPVFTRKAMTDLCYMACVKKLLAARERIFPQFATHNALTVASVIEDAGGVDGYEFQRLHGMGEALYEALLPNCRTPRAASMRRSAATAISSPIWCGGFWRTAPIPRSSRSPPIRSVPIEEILRRPQSAIADPRDARNKKIPLPRDLYRPERQNSSGIEFGDRSSLEALLAEVRAGTHAATEAAPLVDGIALARHRASGHLADRRPRYRRRARGRRGDRADGDGGGRGRLSRLGGNAMRGARRGARRAADLLESHRGELLALLQNEGGKTLDDALAELREAVDYCRYYAAQARGSLSAAALPGPTGESNVLRYRGRGVFVCISPWNFPLAIFLGQVSAALVAGNCGRGEAGGTDAARCRARRGAPASSRRAGDRAPSRARRRHGRCRSGRRAAHRRRLLHRLDRSRPRDQSERSPRKTDRSCR